MKARLILLLMLFIWLAYCASSGCFRLFSGDKDAKSTEHLAVAFGCYGPRSCLCLAVSDIRTSSLAARAYSARAHEQLVEENLEQYE